MFLLLLCFTFCFSAIIEEPEKIIVNDKDEHTLEIQSYKTKDFVITLPYSFKLLIEIDYVNTYTKYGDYLLIKRGPDLSAPGTGLVLTENGYTDKKSILISSDIIYIRLFVGGFTPLSSKNILRKFKLKYKASGTAMITTTESPTSPSTWPTPGPHDKIHYKAHLEGLADVDFANNSFNVYRLKTAIAKMADAYCTDQFFPVKQPIGARNVIISDLIRCPYYWPRSEVCVIINFAVPVVLDESYNGYQLLAKHLEIMWLRYDHHLHKIGLKKYEIHDLDSQLIGWKALTGLVISVLIAAVLIIALLNEFKPAIFDCFRRNKKQDDEQVIIEEEVQDTYVYNENEYDKFKYRASEQTINSRERSSIQSEFDE